MGHHIAVCRHWPGFVLGVLLLPGCLGVEPFGGSNVQFDFAEDVQVAAARGATPDPEQPPADTYYSLYATDFVYRDDDGDGKPDVDMNGEPLVQQAFTVEVHRFEIRAVIDRTSPCFIDTEEAPFPGVHVTQYGAKMREVKGVTDPLDPNVPYNDAVDVLTADRRMELLPRLESEVKAVTTMSTYQYPATAAADDCGTTTAIPHPTCMDDAANAVRLRLCKEAWAAAGADLYEGSDKVFTLPLSGRLFGMVEGMNPVNDVGLIGGASITVDENLVGFDAFSVNWQYKDLDGDGAPDAPAGMERPSGTLYMRGTAEHITRGVINATLRNLTDNNIRGELAVFPDLGHDDVHF